MSDSTAARHDCTPPAGLDHGVEDWQCADCGEQWRLTPAGGAGVPLWQRLSDWEWDGD